MRRASGGGGAFVAERDVRAPSAAVEADIAALEAAERELYKDANAELDARLAAAAEEISCRAMRGDNPKHTLPHLGKRCAAVILTHRLPPA